MPGGVLCRLGAFTRGGFRFLSDRAQQHDPTFRVSHNLKEFSRMDIHERCGSLEYPGNIGKRSDLATLSSFIRCFESLSLHFENIYFSDFYTPSCTSGIVFLLS